jgi:hypothetical protein
MLAATPRWATLPTSRPFHHGLYRRICASIVPPRGINLSLWTSLAIKIWWRYGWKWSLPPPLKMAITPYIARIWPRPLPSIMRRDSPPQERQFKPMDVTRNQDLVEIWVELVAAPPQWPSHFISLAYGPGLYRRLCGGIVHPRSVNLSLWTSLAITIWWRYGVRCSPPPPMAITLYISRIWPRPLPTIMRRDSPPQERQLKPMDVTRNQDLVEL